MLKDRIIDFADWFAAFAKRRAARWLSRSKWWTDFAESVETGKSISDIRKEREGEER